LLLPPPPLLLFCCWLLLVGGKFWNMFCGFFVIWRAPGRWNDPDPLFDMKLTSLGL
jgi:hypothetical protein